MDPRRLKGKFVDSWKNITTSVCSTLSPPLPCPAECTIHSFSRKYSDSPNSSLDIALTSDPAAYATLHSWPAVEVVGAAHHHCGSRRLARLRRATTAILISELKRWFPSKHHVKGKPPALVAVLQARCVASYYGVRRNWEEWGEWVTNTSPNLEETQGLRLVPAAFLAARPGRRLLLRRSWNYEPGSPLFGILTNKLLGMRWHFFRIKWFVKFADHCEWRCHCFYLAYL